MGRKGVLVHFHKCGGHTLKVMFFGPKGVARHYPVVTLGGEGCEKRNLRWNVKYRHEIPDWRERFKFGIVRNPYDRIVSAYEWFNKRRVQHRVAYAFSGSFADFVMVVTNATIPASLLAMQRGIGADYDFRIAIRVHTMPYGSLYYHSHSLDYIGRFERYDESVQHIFTELDTPCPEIPHTHVGRDDRPHYSTYYDSQTRQHVTDYYWDDLERFGYEFEEQS
jgi:hypothetical protein